MVEPDMTWGKVIHNAVMHDNNPLKQFDVLRTKKQMQSLEAEMHLHGLCWEYHTLKKCVVDTTKKGHPPASDKSFNLIYKVQSHSNIC